jgi:MFS family permease
MFVWYGYHWVRSLLLLLRKRFAQFLVVPPSDNPASTNPSILLLRENLVIVVLPSTLVPTMVSSIATPLSRGPTPRGLKVADNGFPGVNSAGSAIGAAICSYAADKWSRKNTIQVAALILVIGAAICAGAVDNAMFLVGRVINGFGIGALVTAIPMCEAPLSISCAQS